MESSKADKRTASFFNSAPTAEQFTETNRDQIFTRIVTTVAIITGAGYLAWRVLYTLNLEALTLSTYYLVLESWSFFGLLLFAHSTWHLNSVEVPEPSDKTNFKVGVLIATYNENFEVLLPTVAAAIRLRPSHETWVLDDGRRQWVEEMCEAIGANYLTRENNAHAKAGNINNALKKLDLDIVAILDADHVPKPGFLRNTLGYFAKHTNLAVVQTPQNFYNDDSFEHFQHFQEEELFYRVLQPGKNRWNASFWCGTSAVLRTTALDSVGGVATESVSEDLLTTLRLHARGWRTIFHNEVLATGMAPSGYTEFRLQRYRWGMGSMEVLRNENPFLKRGLSLSQRLAYLFSLSGWFEAWRTFGYMTLPLLIVATGQIPIRSNAAAYAAVFIPHLAFQTYAQMRMGRGRGHPIWSQLFDIIRMPVCMTATIRLIWPSAEGFRVTPKGRTGDRRDRADYPLFQTAVVGGSAIAIIWFGLTMAGLTPTTYQSGGAITVAAGLTVLNATLISIAVWWIRRTAFGTERRGAWRLPIEMPAQISGRRCTISSLSMSGLECSLPAEHCFVQGEEVFCELPLQRGINLKGTVAWCDNHPDMTTLAVEFSEQQWLELADLANVMFVGRLEMELAWYFSEQSTLTALRI